MWVEGREEEGTGISPRNFTLDVEEGKGDGVKRHGVNVL